MSLAMSRRGSTGANSFLLPRSASFRCPIQSDGFSLNKLRFSSLGLYGRDDEISQLNKAYKDVETTGRKGIVMLSGYTGTGKSAIVKKFMDGIERTSRRQHGKKSFFVAGKFDLHHRAEPYTALISAFTQLVDGIISLKDVDADMFRRIKDSILDAVGSEGDVLSSIIPNLTEILGKEKMKKYESEYESSMVKDRFNFNMRQFIRAVCKEAHPIILFLDDLQWADAASLDLIETIMTDSQLSGMLLVGCYRENEVDESHPLAIRLRIFERDSNPQGGEVDLYLSFIHVGNLHVDTVHDMVTDVLNVCDKQKTLALATTVHEKTKGNIFYVIQFLTTLRDEGMLVYNLGAQDWKWDDDEIKSNTRVSDNVVDLLKTKLQKLDTCVLELLKVASCLGGTSDRSTLLFVAESLHSDDGPSSDKTLQRQRPLPEEGSSGKTLTLEGCLITCAEEGLLEITEDRTGKVSFAHDQIQSAAYSLIPEDERNLFQLCIGEALVNHLAEDELDKMLFVVVDLLNSGDDLISTREERLDLARLNLRAGKKALASSAFAASGAYLEMGILLLGTDPWELDYRLSLDLYNTAMMAEYCKGNFEQVYRYADTVTNLKDKPVQHKLSAYTSLIQCIGDQGQPGKALEVCLSVLAELGIRYDQRLGKLSTVLGLLKIKRLFKKYSLTACGNFPVVEDEFKLKEAKLMCLFGTLASTVKPDLIPLNLLKSFQWSIRNGICQYSTLCFVGYGVLDVACFGNLKEANEFGRFGLSLSKRFDAKEMQSFTATAYLVNISHWVVPLQLVRKEMLQGYQHALQAGDINHAMMCICFFCCICYVTGEPLSKLEADLNKYCKQMEDFNQKTIWQIAVVIWQSVMNLMSCPEDPVLLTGKAMNQDTLMQQCTECKAVHSIFAIRAQRLQLAYLFGRYDLASKLVDRTATKLNAPSILTWRHAIFEGLVASAIARKGRNRRVWKKFALRVVRKIREWVSEGHVNCLHSLHLLEAEIHAVEGKTDEAKQKYDLAIATAGRAGFRMDKAISCERAGELFVEVGDSHWAAHYLSMAHQQYIEWEAFAKADHLFQKHGSLFEKGKRVSFVSR